MMGKLIIDPKAKNVTFEKMKKKLRAMGSIAW